jgi:hypothetical protein
VKAKLLVLGVGVALTVGVVVNGAASGARTESPAVVARQLVANLETARTAGARYQAVLAMMKVLRVPVYNAAGHAVVAGAGGFQRGFNLYDFQLQAAAETLGNEVSLTDLAGALSGARRVDPGKLAASLDAGVAAAVAKSSSSASTLALLVRELGLQQKPPVDLAAKPRLAAVRLDPLQVLLLAVDAAEHKPVAAFRRLAVTTGITDFGCYVPPGSPEPGPSLSDQDWQGEDAVASDSAAMELLPGPSPDPKTHYGPAGHAPLAGRPVRLGVHIQITQRFPNQLTCGPFRNFVKTGRPRQTGGNIPIAWMYGDDVLPRYLDVTRRDGATGSNGEAHVVLEPKNEKVPGFGHVVTRGGIVVATATLPAVLQNYFIRKKASQLRVSVGQIATVELHKPRGFNFQSSFSFVKTIPGPDGGTVTFTHEVDGHACGDDPYAPGIWTLVSSSTLTVNGLTEPTPPVTLTGQTFPDGGEIGIGPSTHLQLVVKAPDIQLLRSETAETYDTPTMQGTFNVEEDTSCPETD